MMRLRQSRRCTASRGATSSSRPTSASAASRSRRSSDAAQARRAQAQPARQPAAATTQAIRAEGQARHLSVHGRRAVAARSLRSQAGARPSTTGRTSPPSSSRASASRSSRARRSCSRSPFQFQPHGQSGAQISELLPRTRQGRRRHRHHPLDAHDAVQPRAGADLHEHRPPGHRPSELRLVAQLRPRQREPATCPASSCCSRARTTPTAASRAGAAASCRPCTRASSSARAATRCCSSRTPTASTPTARRRSITAINDLNRLQHGRRRRPRDRRRASPPTSWPTACRPACRS